MSTTYDRLRAAADNLDQFAEDCRNPDDMEELARRLRADADRLQAVEAEARKVGIGNQMRLLVLWADRIRGEAT